MTPHRLITAKILLRASASISEVSAVLEMPASAFEGVPLRPSSSLGTMSAAFRR